MKGDISYKAPIGFWSSNAYGSIIARGGGNIVGDVEIFGKKIEESKVI